MKRQLTFAFTTLALISCIAMPGNADDAAKPGRVKLVNQTENQGSTGSSTTQDRSVPSVIGSPNGQNSGSASLNSDGATGTPMPSAFTLDRSFLSNPNGGAGIRLIENPFQPRVRFIQKAGGQQGYDNGYTQAGVFLPYQISRNELYFIDGRGFVAGSGGAGANVGIGVRQYDPTRDSVKGISFWWDYDDGAEDTYHQLGASYSHVTRYWRFRVNGYFITSDPNRVLSQTPTGGGISYESIFITQSVISREETAYSGVDVELGAPMPFLGQYGFNWYGALYYNEGKGNKDGLGVRANIEAQITEDWSMGATISDDQVFGTNAQIDLQYTFPNGGLRPSRWFRQAPIYEYMARGDRRRYRVNTKVSEFVQTRTLTNPTDGAAIRVAHIVPDSVQGVAPAGDGTIENPYNSTQAYNDALLGDRQSYDIILVRGGDGTGTNLNSGINVFDNQRLLAISRAHTFTASEGTFALPGTGLAGLATPILSNQFEDANNNGILDPGEDFDGDGVLDLGGPVVTLDGSFSVAQDALTEVSGFIIDGANDGTGFGGPLNIGIESVNGPISGFTINNNTFQNFLGAARIAHTGTLHEDVDYDGVLDTVNEDIDGDGNLDVAEDANGNGLLDLGEDIDGDGNLDVAEDVDGDGNLDVIEDIDLDGVLDVGQEGIFVFNTINGAGNDSNFGVSIAHSNESMLLDLRGNTITNVLGEDRDNNGILSLVDEDANMNGILDPGEDLNLDGVLNVIEDNDGDGTLAGDIGIAVSISSTSGATQSRILGNNSGDLTQPYGIQDNIITGNGAGIQIEAFSGATNSELLLDVVNNNVSDNNSILGFGYRSGAFGANSVATYNLFTGNTIDNNGGPGAQFFAGINGIPGGTLNFSNPIAGNSFNNNGTDGLQINGFGPASDINIAGIGDPTVANSNSFNGNTGNGFVLSVVNSTVDSGDMMASPTLVLNNTFNDNGDNGFLGIFDASTVAIDFGDRTGTTVGNTFNNNGATSGDGDGLDMTAINGSTISVGIANSEIEENAGNGVQNTWANSTITEFFMSNNNVELNQLGGVINTATDSTITDYTFDGNIVLDSLGGDGLGFAFTNTNTALLDISNNGLQRNAGNGLNLGLDNSDIATFILEGNTQGQTQVAGTLDLDFRNLIWTTFLDNNSTAGVDIASVTIDLAGTTQVWRPDLNPFATGFQPNGGTDITTGLQTVNGNTITPGTNPLQDGSGAILPDGGVVPGSTVLNLTFNDFNAGEQLDYDLAHNTGTGTGLDGGGLLNGASITATLADGRSATGVLDSGFNSDVFATLSALRSGISDNALNGVLITAANGSDITNMSVDNNNIEFNGQNGFEIATTENSTVTGTLNNSNVSNNTLEGFRITTWDTSNVNLTDMSGNTVGTNGSFGMHIVSNDQSTYGLTMGTTGANTFNSNVDAGLAIEMFNQSVANTLNIANSTFNATTDNAATLNFAGEGVKIITTDAARITDGIIGSVATNDTFFTNNAASGFAMDISGQSLIADGADIDGFGMIVRNVTASSNGGDGLEFIRRNDSQFQDVLIVGSTIDSNVRDGIDIQGFGGNTDVVNPALSPFTNSFEIGSLIPGQGNTITNSGVNGIDLLASADIFLNVGIFGNTITGTVAGDGIEANTDFFGRLTGSWDGNTISNTNQDGISLDATDSDGDVGSIAGQFLNISNNTIDLAGGDGARISSTTTDADDEDDMVISFNGNTITNSTGNGVTVLGDILGEVRLTTFNGNTITDNGGDGLNVTALAASDIRINSAVGNTISRNVGDGVELNRQDLGEIVAATTGDGTALTPIIDSNTSGFVDNIVTFNGGAGYRILNTDQGETVVRIGGTVDPRASNGALATSVIAENGANGILLQNDSNNQRNQSPILRAQIVNTAVTGNGRDATLTDDERNGIWARTGTSDFGYSIYDIRQNYLSGNQNVDFVVDTFVSTPDPSVVNPFTGNQDEDPLARVYLQFRFNEGDQIDVTRVGAFYDNGDTFKSPERFYSGPAGTTQGTARRRNATKVEVTLDDSNFYNFDDGFVVGGGTAATTTQFNTSLANIPNTVNDYENGIITIPPFIGPTRQITNTAINAGNVRLTTGALPAAPAPGTPFSIDWIGIAGVGQSTLVTADTDLAAGGNNFATVLSDFNSVAGIDPFGTFIDDSTAIGEVYGDFAPDGIFNGNYEWSVGFPPPNPGVVFPDEGTGFVIEPIIFP